jgi:hypothetical protein
MTRINDFFEQDLKETLSFAASKLLNKSFFYAKENDRQD